MKIKLTEQKLREFIKDLLSEIKIKRVVRNGKRVKKKISKPGYKITKDGKQVRMKASEKIARKKAQKKGARKRKAKKSIINRKRKKSMKKVR